MTSETSMVELRRVTKRWGSFTAVADVSLEVRAGEFMTSSAQAAAARRRC